MGIRKKKSLMACPANTVFWGDFMKKQREEGAVRGKFRGEFLAGQIE